VEYLRERAAEKIAAPEMYMDRSDAKALDILRQAEAAVGATEIEVSKRLYVGNLPPDTTAEELRGAFDTAGLPIKTVGVPPRSAGNKTRLFAIVEMMDGKSAIAAIDSPTLSIRGRRLLIQEAHNLSDQITSRKSGRIPKMDITERVYITGMSSAASEDGIRALFHRHALQPIDVFVPKNRHTGESRGFGFVTMSSQAEAMQAIGALNGVLLDGSSLSVRPAEPPRTQHSPNRKPQK
jgi:nucleolin